MFMPVSIAFRVCVLVAALASSAAIVSAQQAPPTQQDIHLDVSVATKPGEPVPGLQQQDFTLLDNASAQPVTSFKAIGPGQEPVEVILLMDAVNTRFDTVAYEQSQIQHFLRSSATMAHPTNIAVLTDKGVQMQQGFSTDGNALSHLLDGYSTGLRQITRSAGYWGATERLQISLTAAKQLTAYAAKLPGRKIIIWISPGWPLLSGPRMELDSKQERQIFNEIVSFSSSLREARITLYNINPLGVDEPLLGANYYREFVKGVRKPGETRIGDLGLQVLAVQSGGLALESDNDVANSLQRCVADTESWYEITFPAPPAEQPNEYHHIEIKLNKAGLAARTRDGYYAQPAAIQ
jgi:VWFA-related protein